QQGSWWNGAQRHQSGDEFFAVHCRASLLGASSRAKAPETNHLPNRAQSLRRLGLFYRPNETRIWADDEHAFQKCREFIAFGRGLDRACDLAGVPAGLALVCREGMDRDGGGTYERLGLVFPRAGNCGDDRAGRRPDGSRLLLVPPRYGPVAIYPWR